MAERQRYDYLDNLKVFLTLLVVVHHGILPYAHALWWPYQNPTHVRCLTTVLGVDAAFFMGLFFFISGYFHPDALRRKGPRRFLVERLRRLGIPLALFSVLCTPILMYIYHVNVRHGEPGFAHYVTRYFLGFGPRPDDWAGPSWPDFNFMHMWFVEHLLVYAILFALWRCFRPEREVTPPPQDTFTSARVHKAAVIYAVCLALVTALVELPYPQDRWMGFLGFIQMEPYHVPQYASLFILGTMAVRGNWLARIPASAGYVWLGIGAALALALYGNRILWPFPFKLWTPWQALTCTALCIGLLVLFRENFGKATPLTRWFARNAFGVYIFHYPIVIALQYALAPAAVPPILAAAVIAALGIVISYGVAYACLRLVPYADRVL